MKHRAFMACGIGAAVLCFASGIAWGQAQNTTTSFEYDVAGNPPGRERIIASNGNTTDLSYGPRGWLTQQVVTAGGVSQATRYDYDGAGNY